MEPTLLSPENLDVIDRQLAERGAALATHYERAEKRLAELTARHDEALKAQLSGAQSDERSLVRQITGRSQARELNALRRQVRDETDEQRRGILSKVSDYEAAIATTEGLYRSPVQVLGRTALGDPKRGQYLQQLANAGPAELQSAADLALATGDRALASAVLVTADRDSKKYSQFDRPAFAQKVVGPEVQAMQQRLAEMRVTIDAMRKLNRAFDRSGDAKLSPRDKIEIGLAKKRLADRNAA